MPSTTQDTTIGQPVDVAEYTRRAAEAFVRAADAGLIDGAELAYLLDHLTGRRP
jgi:hypothetical protein